MKFDSVFKIVISIHRNFYLSSLIEFSNWNDHFENIIKLDEEKKKNLKIKESFKNESNLINQNENSQT